MKKIINGRLYNTESATRLGDWYNGYNSRDFRHCYEALYRKANGEFFLYVTGGPLSIYAKSNGNDMCGDEDIIKMSTDEAKAWAEKRLTADEYLELFDIEE